MRCVHFIIKKTLSSILNAEIFFHRFNVLIRQQVKLQIDNLGRRKLNIAHITLTLTLYKYI